MIANSPDTALLANRRLPEPAGLRWRALPLPRRRVNLRIIRISCPVCGGRHLRVVEESRSWTRCVGARNPRNTTFCSATLSPTVLSDRMRGDLREARSSQLCLTRCVVCSRLTFAGSLTVLPAVTSLKAGSTALLSLCRPDQSPLRPWVIVRGM